ncbi:MAG TPA: hypothetical protein VHM19_18235, partial [Polyangiales bacterium]|nr:hypothetical protein [Polyangiales bacterium]
LSGKGHHEMLALTLGNIDAGPTLVRVQMGSVLGDVFGARHGTRLIANEAMQRIEQEGKGVILYIPPRGDLVSDLDYHMGRVAERPAPAHEIVLREVGFGSQVLMDLGVRKMRLITNTPSRIVAVDGFDLEIVEQVLLRAPTASDADSAPRTTH